MSYKMRKTPVLRAVFGVVALSTLLVFTACPNDSSDSGGGDSNYDGDVSGHVKKTINGDTVRTLVYIEVNDHNPLNAMDYVLTGADGEAATYFFDYVVLFSANIRSRDCSLETTELDQEGKLLCNKKGPHVHLNRQTKYVLAHKDTLIKPLQDKGMKVLLGLLGDHDGIGFAAMNASEIATFVADVKKTVADYGLDGVDFDDEWANAENWLEGDGTTNESKVNPAATKLVYPTMDYWWPFPDAPFKATRDPAKGVVAGNYKAGTTEAELATMWKAGGKPYYDLLVATRAALPNKVITVYEYNFGRYIVNDASGVTTGQLAGLVDYTLNPMYNQFIGASQNSISNSKYAPLAADLGGNAYSSQKGTPNPPFIKSGSEVAAGTIADFTDKFLDKSGADAYGMMFFYDLRESSYGGLKYDQDGQEAGTWNDEANRRTQADYLSKISQALFEKNVVVVTGGGDHLKTW